MRNSRNRQTYDFDNEKYSPELIRQYEDPEYAKAAEKYEREARRRKAGRHSTPPEEASYDNFEEMLEAQYGIDSDKPRNRRDRKRKKKSGKKRKYRVNKVTVLRNILLIVLLLVVAGTGFFFYMTRGIEPEEIDDTRFAINEQAAEEMKDYRNILILGSDARADEPIENSRTDAIIIMSINKKTSDVRLISVMRDSYLQMEDMDGDLILDKLTHAHAYGGGVNTAASLNRSLDLNIREYVVFNWQAVADAVDCLGGIEVDVQEDELQDLNHYGYETAENVGRDFHEIQSAGVQTMDGVQATTYCRIRKTSGGDEGRTGRYKKVVAGVMKKAISHPWKLSELTDTVFPNIRTNMKQTNMLSAGVRAPLFDIQEGVSWPEDYWDGLLYGVSYVVPDTLESNVRMLHEKAFEQNGYSVSPECREISDSIINDTGVY